MAYRFDWSVLWSGQSGLWLLQGLITTLELSAAGWLLAAALGVLAGAVRTLPTRWPRSIATFYVEFFRNVPLLVWMFFWYFAMLPLLPRTVHQWLLSHGAAFWAAVLALGFYYGARSAEVIRSGIQSVPKTHLEAALAIGLSVWRAYRLVILPEALRLIIPPATNETISLLKSSSLALTISVAELTFQTRQIETYTAKAVEALVAATLIYLLLCVCIGWIMGRVERRFAIPGLIAKVEAG